MTDKPTIEALSLGAGVQSSVLLMLSAAGILPKLDVAIFADTGWEPKAVYEHLNRLEAEVAKPAGIPIIRVSVGNIRDDALDPEHRFASMPLFVYGPPTTVRDPLETAECDCRWAELDEDDLVENGGTVPAPPPCTKCGNTGTYVSRWGEPRTERSLGMTRRQCTSEYKIKPIKRAVRELLGYPHPTPVPGGGVCRAVGGDLPRRDRPRQGLRRPLRPQHLPAVGPRWRRRRAQRLDPRRLPAVPHGKRLQKDPEVGMRRMFIPRQPAVA